jgi:glucan phosphoethanolaminetransferase (alkaline phosphatase superfamily)
MGLLYVGLACIQFKQGFSFAIQHLLVLLVWILDTVLIYALFSLKFSRSRWILMFIPVGSYFVLYLIYLSASISNSFWGTNPTMNIIFRFIPEIPRLMKNMDISWILVIFILAAPFAAGVVLYRWGFDQTDQKIRNYFLMDGRSPQKSILRRLTWETFVCLLGTYLLFTQSTSFIVKNFRCDPVIGLFSKYRFTIPMNQERFQWAQRDLLAKKPMHVRQPRYKNIILFIVDSLRPDRLPFYGYPLQTTPFLWKKMSELHFLKVQTIFSNGTSSGPGILSVLTSKNSDVMSDYSYTLSDCLTDQGFRSYLFLTGDHESFGGLKVYGKKTYRLIDGVAHPGPDGIDDDYCLLQMTSELKPDEGLPHFFYYHLMSVHDVGFLHEKYTDSNLLRPLGNKMIFKTTIQRDSNKSYDFRIIQADDIIRQILNQLQRGGYLRDSLIVITADHGWLLGENGMRGHVSDIAHANLLRIPLLIFSPKPIPSLAQTDFAIQLDIAPTLLDMAGLDVPGTWQGESLLHKRKSKWSFHGGVQHAEYSFGSVVYRDSKKFLKYACKISNKGVFRDEILVDLYQDADEKNNLISSYDKNFVKIIREKAFEHFQYKEP